MPHCRVAKAGAHPLLFAACCILLGGQAVPGAADFIPQDAIVIYGGGFSALKTTHPMGEEGEGSFHGQSFSALNQDLLVESDKGSVHGHSFSALNQGLNVESDMGQSAAFFGPAYSVLNTALFTDEFLLASSENWSLYNGDDLEYIQGMPPYIQSLELFDLDGLPYEDPGLTDEPTVRVEVRSPWELDGLLLSDDFFATTAEVPFSNSFEYTFSNAHNGVKTLWVRGIKDGRESTSARAQITLIMPHDSSWAVDIFALY